MTFTRGAIRELHAAAHDSIRLVLECAAALPPGLLDKELPGFGQPTVRRQLAHALGAEERWVRRLQSLTNPASPRIPGTAGELRALEQSVAAATRAYLDSIDDERLNAVLKDRPPEWIGALNSPAFILLHAITHAFHHKGQIVAMLRLLGHPAPDTDMQRA